MLNNMMSWPQVLRYNENQREQCPLPLSQTTEPQKILARTPQKATPANLGHSPGPPCGVQGMRGALFAPVGGFQAIMVLPPDLPS